MQVRYPRVDSNLLLSPKRLDTEIKHLEEEILRWQLRGQWADRRMIAMESQQNRDRGTLFVKQNRLQVSSPTKNEVFVSPSTPHSSMKVDLENSFNSDSAITLAGGTPSMSSLHNDVTRRIEMAENISRRIQDAILETESLKAAQSKSHSERMEELRQRYHKIRDRKYVLDSQLRVAEGELKDDEMLSDSQYRRYAVRIEKDRQESMKRHDGGLRQLAERTEQRCNYIQRETNEMAKSLEKLVLEKTAELDRLQATENAALHAASQMGERVEEVENADAEMRKMNRTIELITIKERETRNDAAWMEDECKKSVNVIAALDGKLDTLRASGLESKSRAQAAVIEGLTLSVRTLQKRIGDTARAQRLLPASSRGGSPSSSSTYDSVEVQEKVNELEGLRYATRLDFVKREDELARLSDHFLYVDGNYREALLAGELLNSQIMKLRVDLDSYDREKIDRPIRPVSMMSLLH